jgi:thiol-disulfide isomerase/thioredoxin
MKILRTAAAICSLGVAIPASAQRAIDLEIGATAPDMQLETLDGKPVNLSAYLGKTAVVMEVWATWCPNCEELAPKILAAQKKYGDQVKFIGIAVSFNQSPERVKRHMERHGFDIETFYDRKGAADVVYGVKATSTIIAINRAGKIVYAGAGGNQDVDALVRKAL